MSNIVEYVGKEGVKSTPCGYARLKHPRPGDLVRWNDGSYGMIEKIGGPDSWVNEGHVHVCASLGSAFLGRHDDGTVYVSISGGPFTMLNAAEFAEGADGLRLARFWNWADRGAGGGHGVEYHVIRPVFPINRPQPT